MHVMLDLETFGTRPGCVVRSIGACAFGLDGAIRSEFYANICERSSLDAGLSIDPAAAEWWRERPQAVQDALRANQQPLSDTVADFARWYRSQGARFVWAQGSDFDIPIWRAACGAVHAKEPWQFHNARDTRTAYALFGFDPRWIPREGIHHNALDDARHQVACVAAAIRQGRPPARSYDLPLPAAALQWVRETFGDGLAASSRQRALRFFEEACELVQTQGLLLPDAAMVAGRVFAREPGEARREIAQAQLTLLALSENAGVGAMHEAAAELDRVRGLPKDYWLARHAAKSSAGIADAAGDAA